MVAATAGLETGVDALSWNLVRVRDRIGARVGVKARVRVWVRARVGVGARARAGLRLHLDIQDSDEARRLAGLGLGF